MKLLLITQNFPPETGAVANRLKNLTDMFQAKGVELTVIAPLPNYPGMEIFPEFRNKWRVKRKENGITIVYSYIFAKRTRSIFLRFFSYFSFVVSSFIEGLRAKGPFDYIFFDAPPLFSGISAIFLKRLKGRYLVVNMSDLWVESAQKLELVRNDLLLKLLQALETWIYKNADIIFAQTNGIVKLIASRFPEKPVYQFLNGADIQFYKKHPPIKGWRKRNDISEDCFMLLYIGLLGHAQNLDVILDAANYLQEENNVCIIIAGDGPEKDRILELAASMELKNVKYIGVVPRVMLSSIIDAADACIVPLKPIDLFRAAIPSKIFDSLVMKKPILLGVDGEAREKFVNEAKAGLFFEPGNAIALARQIRYLSANRKEATEMGNRGYQLILNQFDRNKISESVYDILRNHLGNTK